MLTQHVLSGVTKCLLLRMWGACHSLLLLLELRIGTANGLIGSQQLDLNDETYIGSLLGSVASELLHLQVLVLL
jgi:hypothetical protein